MLIFGCDYKIFFLVLCNHITYIIFFILMSYNFISMHRFFFYFSSVCVCMCCMYTHCMLLISFFSFLFFNHIFLIFIYTFSLLNYLFSVFILYSILLSLRCLYLWVVKVIFRGRIFCNIFHKPPHNLLLLSLISYILVSPTVFRSII